MFFLFSLATAEDFPLSEERVSEIKSSLIEWRKITEDRGTMSDSEYLEKLGFGLRKTSPSGPYTVGDRAGTHHAIKNKILSIPGHAEYFGGKIKHLYGEIKQGYANGKNTGEVGWSHYMTESMEAFKTLSMLPSHETVRVLGEMLSDDWKWPDYEKDNFYGTLDTYSLTFLSRLPIANQPTKQLKTSEDMYEYLEDWKQWYAEIKSGRRTFRFVGDDTEYDLRGPVKRSGSVERERSARRNLPEAVTEKTKPKDTPFQNRLIPYLVGLLILGAGLTIYLRGRRSAA